MPAAGFLLGSLFCGLAVGSFLNVAILRIGRERLTGRSRCFHCGVILRWRELIPVFSFFFQQGRCRNCKVPLSWQYPVVEALTGILFFLIAARFLSWFPSFFFSPAAWWVWLIFIFWLIFASFLILIAVYDLRHYLIPDVFIWPAVGAAVVYAILLHLFWLAPPALFPETGIVFSGAHGFLLGRTTASSIFTIIGVLVSVFIIGGIWLLSRGKAMGFGDVEVALFLGLSLGWPDALLALLLSFIFGTMASVFLILAGRKQLRSVVPFAPFLALGAMTTMLFGDTILNAYFVFLPNFFLP
jgi:leader peptidase (prepilin peptidase)/N-methyltransferase